MWEIERLSERDADRAGETLARAFYTDPVAEYMLPDPGQRSRLLPWHFSTLVRYGALFGEVYATTREIRGVAVWLKPGRTEMTPERLAAAGVSRADEVLGTAAWERFLDVMQFLEGLHAADMVEVHWYLMAIGVDPEAAGKGLGSALLRPVLQAADAQARTCYLETAAAENRPFYERHGFLVLRQGVEPGSGLDYWTFRRDPQ